MSLPFDWIYFASCDFVDADKPAADGAIPAIPSFNLNSVGWRSSTGDRPRFKIDPKDGLKSEWPLLPWGVYPATDGQKPDSEEDPLPIKPGVLGENFYMLAFDDPVWQGGDGKDKELYREKTSDKPLDEAFGKNLTLLKRAKPNPDFSQAWTGCLAQKSYEQLRPRWTTVDKEGIRDFSKLIHEVHLENAANETSTEPWSQALAGGSQQGYPASHILNLSVWLAPSWEDGSPKSTAVPQGKSVVLFPEKVMDRKVSLISILAPPANGTDILRVAVTYRATDDLSADVVLVINAHKLDSGTDLASQTSLVGVSQSIDARLFTNWLGTLPENLGRFLDLIWLKRYITARISPDARADAKASFVEMERQAAALVASAGIGVGLNAAKLLHPTDWWHYVSLEQIQSLLREDPKPRTGLKAKHARSLLAAFHKPGEHWIEPALHLLQRFATLGLPPHVDPAAEDAKTQIQQSMAFELLSAIVARRAPGAAGSLNDSVTDALSDLINTPDLKKGFVPDPFTDESETVLWTRNVLLQALRDADGDKKGDSHGGFYQELLQWLDWEAADRTPKALASALEHVCDEDGVPEIQQDISEAFFALEDKALQQLSHVSEDQEVLRRIFCLWWDCVFDRLRTLAAQSPKEDPKGFIKLWNKWQLLLGTPERRSDGRDHLLLGRSMELLADYAQEVSFQFSKRYGDELAKSILEVQGNDKKPLLAELLEEDLGALIIGLYQDFADLQKPAIDEKSPPGSIAGDELKKTDRIKTEDWQQLCKPELGLPNLESWRPQLKDRDYITFLLRCAGLIAANPPDLSDEGDSKADADAKTSLVRAVQAQLFLAAAYLGRSLLFMADTHDLNSEPGSPSVVDSLAQMLCLPDKGNAGNKDSKENAEDPINHWKQQPWTYALIGLDQRSKSAPVPPALPVPLIFSGSEYQPERNAGVLVMARRRDPKGDPANDKGWWLINVGEPVYLDGRKFHLDPNSKPSKPGHISSDQPADQNRMEIEEDEVQMEWLKEIGHRLTKGMASVAPWQIGISHGVVQGFMDYRGQPLSVRLWDAAADDPNQNGQIASTDPNTPLLPDIQHRLAHYQIISEDDGYQGWGPVPGLRYSAGHEYDFLFIPIHNTGALPPIFRSAIGAGEIKLGGLWKRDAGNLPKDFRSHMVTVKNYLRRIPVGQVRLAIDKSSPSTPHLSQYGDYTAPYVPKGVLPLCDDLTDDDAREHVKNLKPFIIEEKDKTKEASNAGRAKSKPLTTPKKILLRNNTRLSGDELEQALKDPRKKGELAGNATQFTIRPPATSVENWTIWQSSLIDQAQAGQDPLLANVLDCIADMNRVVRELSRSGDPVLQKARGLEVNQLIDDPAVAGVSVQIRLILDLRSSKRQEIGQKSFYIPFEHKPLTGYKLTDNDPNIVNGVLGSEVQLACRNIVQTHSSSFTVRWVSYANEVKFEKQGAGMGSDYTISVPEGCVLEIAMIPCIPKGDWVSEGAPNRWARIYKNADLETIAEKDGVFAVKAAIYRIWVESVPHAWGPKPSQSPAPYLPAVEKVWSSLRLAEVGTWAREARRVPRLEIAVCPRIDHPDALTNDASSDEFRRWSFVSEVRARIQPWVWRGVPEGPELNANAQPSEDDPLSALLNPKYASSVGDEDPTVLENLVRGEAPSFGEREPAAAAVQKGLVNYAALFHAIQSGQALNDMPPFIISQDRGQQDEVPRYFRVELLINSRYAGFGMEGGNIDHSNTVGSMFEWDWTGLAKAGAAPVKNARTSTHRRILFRGSLKRQLDLPRVKMVIPLMEALPPSNRPGFIVITREPLPSPWHRLIAEVEWARVNLSTNETDEIIKERPEFGRNVLTSGEAFNLAFQSITDLREQGVQTGRAFGLTHEREANDPLFPNAGFYFGAPYQATGMSGNERAHDWFAKVKFAMQIGPSYVMDNEPDKLTSPFTQGWQVQLLAPFRWLNFSKKTDFVDLRHLTFSLPKGEAFPTFRGGGTDAGQPSLPVFDRNSRNKNASPASVLLFVTWALVPDFLTAERSKVAHTIFAYLPGETSPRILYRNDLKDQLKPDGGNFLLLFGRRGDVDDLADHPKKPDPKSQAPKKQPLTLEMLVEEYLFPLPQSVDPNSRIDQDAKLMITRCSCPIFSS